MRNIFGSLIFIFFTSPLFAEVPPILSASQWKKQQTTEAENRIVRINNRIMTVKKAGNLNELKRLDSDLRVAAQNLEVVKQFTLEDYFIVYLSQLLELDGAIEKATDVMSKDEMAALIKIMLRVKNTSSSEVSSSAAFSPVMRSEESSPL